MDARGRRLASGFGLCLSLVAACPEPPEEPAERPLNWAPAAFGGVIPSPARNPLTTAGVALGRRLFYDASLSANGAVSCASCHRQRLAFADAQPLGSQGVAGQPLERHAPTLHNLAWADQGLFWDGGASDLESLMAAPLLDEHEMAADPSALVNRLRNDPSYRSGFSQAFDAEPSLALVMRALAQFVRTLVSAGSRYDAYIAGQEELSDDELAGLRVFERACSGCHPAPFFTDHGFHDLGLELDHSEDPEDVRKGRARITERSEDLGRFKTPSLRNVTLSAPYGHDGRFPTLRAVLDSYRHGMQATPNLDPVFRRHDGAIGLDLSDDEVEQLESFLATLTDPELTTRHEWSAP